MESAALAESNWFTKGAHPTPQISPKLLKSLLITIVLFAIFAVSDAFAQDCSYWNASVGVKSANGKLGAMDETKTANILTGIECLLKLEGDRSRGAFSGATSFSGPANLPPSTVEICALYYISKLFYNKSDHARGIALRFKSLEKSTSINSDEAVRTAFENYRKWFIKVKEIGLEEARKQNLDPLAGSEVRWY